VSSRSGRVPLEYAYLAIQVRDLLAAPGRFADGPPETWRLQSQVEYLSFMAGQGDAEREARRLAEIDPASPVPWYDLAQIAASRGDAPAARQLLGEAVRRSPRYSGGYLALARILARRQQAGPAQELLEAGCEAFPDDVSLGLALANVYATSGSVERATTHLAAMAGRLPRYPEIHAALAFALRGSGRGPAAEAAWADFLRTAPAGGMRRDVIEQWEARKAEPPPEGR
jgi:predicted Zn-dependent protease